MNVNKKETAVLKCYNYLSTENNVRFQILAVASMKMTVFWHVVPCSPRRQ
jgi:hypothetical protein